MLLFASQARHIRLVLDTHTLYVDPPPKLKNKCFARLDGGKGGGVESKFSCVGNCVHMPYPKTLNDKSFS